MNRPYQKIVAWQLAHSLCIQIYKLTKSIPQEERYRLVSQMCRSAYSVPMNLAEGNAKRFPKEKKRFYGISLASLEELHYQCLLAKDLQYISNECFVVIENNIGRVSYFITKMKNGIRS